MDERPSSWILAAFEVKIVEVTRPVRQGGEFESAVRDADVPTVILKGRIHLQAPSGRLLEAVTKALPEGIRRLEDGASAAWSVALSPDSDGSAVHCTAMAVDSMVRIGR